MFKTYSLYALLAAVALSIVNTDASPNAAAESGVQGVLLRSPAQGGPTRQDVPDTAPFAQVELTVQRDGETVATVKTDGQGGFRLSLPPGKYTVSVKGAKRGVGSCGPFELRVDAGEMKQVRWECDTGIR